jgi:hypothetical protein
MPRVLLPFGKDEKHCMDGPCLRDATHTVRCEDGWRGRYCSLHAHQLSKHPIKEER